MFEIEKTPELENPFEGSPHGWLQWKGTDACIDFHCKCGSHLHADNICMYFIRCGKCGQAYALNGHIKLHPIDEERAAKVSIFEIEPRH